jgi:hypothetical protein
MGNGCKLFKRMVEEQELSSACMPLRSAEDVMICDRRMRDGILKQ